MNDELSEKIQIKDTDDDMDEDGFKIVKRKKWFFYFYFIII